jgi:hypothetical protein
MVDAASVSNLLNESAVRRRPTLGASLPSIIRLHLGSESLIGNLPLTIDLSGKCNWASKVVR